jgi:hypothetical protein
MTADEEMGKAWKAFTAFNFHQKTRSRLASFEPERWLKVVRALNGAKRGRPAGRSAWEKKGKANVD